MLAVIILKGISGEGQPELFRSVLKNYIEETSASISYQSRSPMQLADLSSLSSMPNNEPGQGGSQSPINPLTVNDNSLAAHSPVSTDYVEISTNQRQNIIEYTVQEGDALSFIASDFGVSMNSIIWANNLKNIDSISPGQTLKIPPVSGVIHQVKSGDTIASLAKKYGVQEAGIISFNDLPANGFINIGDQIIVPDGILSGVKNSGSTVVTAVPPTEKAFSYLPDLGDFFFLPTNGYNWGKIHGRNGVDIANSCGTPIYASADGSVITADGAGYNGGFGQYIKIIHDNGTETLYAHASKILVETGNTVSRGQKIALMGSTGRSTGCHLHFEVHGARNPFAKY